MFDSLEEVKLSGNFGGEFYNGKLRKVIESRTMLDKLSIQTWNDLPHLSKILITDRAISNKIGN